MFKSGGYNVYPLEVEQVLEKLDGVSTAIVVPVPDRLYSEVGYAFIQPETGRSISVSDLQDHCRRSLANYKIPKAFHFVDDFPLLPVGKVDRRAVKALALAEQES
jgi:acyl-CoA synthetase (AMP-forming)/AMP-acid ligase II